MRRSEIRDARHVEVRLKHLNLHRQERAILSDVSWTIRPGQRWLLAGGNGAGKTQLLKVIAGAVWPTPQADDSHRRSRRYRWDRKTFWSPFGIKEQMAYLGPELQDKYERYGWNHSVEQLVGTGLYHSDIPLDRLTGADRRRIATVLTQLAIAPLAARDFLSLSYGERRLTLLARALAGRPGIVLLDELLGGLDAVNHDRALGWLERTARSDLPWVLATHRADDVPASATHALVLDRGRVVYRGPVNGAPLEKWLPGRSVKRVARVAARASGHRHRSPGRTPSRLLVRLRGASVYLDERRVLHGLSFEVRARQCWVVHGRNGSGKTTLLRTLYGDHGIARGGRIERIGIAAGIPLQVFKRRVGLVAPHIHPAHQLELTVAEVVQSGRYASIGLNERPTAADRAAARRQLEAFGLSNLSSRTLREVSYGQLRRVFFARAWICRPLLLLLDEPFSGVDGPTRRVLMTRMVTAMSHGTAVVMSTHHHAEWPECATHELQLSGGRALYAGPVR